MQRQILLKHLKKLLFLKISQTSIQLRRNSEQTSFAIRYENLQYCLQI